MYPSRTRSDSVWQSLKIIFMGALLIFLINIYFGFDNSLTSEFSDTNVHSLVMPKRAMSFRVTSSHGRPQTPIEIGGRCFLVSAETVQRALRRAIRLLTARMNSSAWWTD